MIGSSVAVSDLMLAMSDSSHEEEDLCVVDYEWCAIRLAMLPTSAWHCTPPRMLLHPSLRPGGWAWNSMSPFQHRYLSVLNATRMPNSAPGWAWNSVDRYQTNIRARLPQFENTSTLVMDTPNLAIASSFDLVHMDCYAGAPPYIKKALRLHWHCDVYMVNGAFLCRIPDLTLDTTIDMLEAYIWPRMEHQMNDLQNLRATGKVRMQMMNIVQKRKLHTITELWWNVLQQHQLPNCADRSTWSIDIDDFVFDKLGCYIEASVEGSSGDAEELLMASIQSKLIVRTVNFRKRRVPH